MITTTSDIQTLFPTILSDYDYDRLFVLCDEHTASLCYPLVPFPDNAIRIVIPSGEENKGLSTLSLVWDELIRNQATRHSMLINLGGGVVTDLGGFAAATFKRGIRYINIPTTLLAMIDASTGGKTGVNYQGLKNEIGAFHVPEHVLLCPIFLRTLDSPSILSGIAEMLKHCLISPVGQKKQGEDLSRAKESCANVIGPSTTASGALSSFSCMETIADVHNITADTIASSIAVKEYYVTLDPIEEGPRKALNFGHTLGHAIESLLLDKGTPVAHGYAIAWGMIGELYLSHVVSGLPVYYLRQAAHLLRELYGPCPITCSDYDTLYSYMQHDKKNISDAILFVLLSAPGSVLYDNEVPRELILESLDFIREG